jgi:uncharacterized protein
MMTQTKPLPDVDLPLTAPFWAALHEHRLAVQRCENCGTQRYPAAPICPACLTPGGTWITVEAVGTLWSHVVYHRPLAAGFADDVPYAVGLVEVGDLQIIARIDGPLEAIKAGARMRPRFTDLTDRVTLLSWVPEPHADAPDT